MTMNRRMMINATIATGIVSSVNVGTPALAAKPEIYLKKRGLVGGAAWTHAAGGMDVVAYHSLEAGAAPVPGAAAFETEYKGAKWLFASQENLDKFTADPDKYRPRYGGHCAWAMARNKLAHGDPAVWHIHTDGALYLNVSKKYKKEWLAHVERDIARADANWPTVLG